MPNKQQHPDIDYYSILNVDRRASRNDIRNAYFILSREFHPDKNDDSLLKDATEQFHIIDRAYKVLSDSVLRKAYDDYGELGLQALESNPNFASALSVHLENPELRRHIERIIRRHNERNLTARIPNRCGMTLNFDARDAVSEKKLSLMDVSEMAMQQTVQIPVSRKNQLNVGGYIVSRSGMAFGSLLFGIHRDFSRNSSGTVSFEVGDAMKTVIAGARKLSKHSTGSMRFVFGHSGPDLNITLSRELFYNLTGSMGFSQSSGMNLELRRATEFSSSQATLNLSLPGIGCSVSHYYQLTNKSHAKALMNLRLDDFAVEIQGGRSLSERSRINVGVRMALQGVFMKLKYSRGSVRFTIPILISPLSRKSPLVMVGIALTQIGMSALIKQLVKPNQKRKRNMCSKLAAQQRIQYLEHARESAAKQQNLMRRLASIRSTAEKENNGIYIIVARYGENPSTEDPMLGQDEENSRINPLNVDVTIPLQFFVQDSTLHLHFGTKSGLLGFYDPCVGWDFEKDTPSKSKLYIRYSYKGIVYDATFDDEQEVILPSRYACALGKSDMVQ